MIKVRVTSATPVVVGHRQLLPGETHEVAGGDLNAAVVLYGADAFKVLGGAPVVVEVDDAETDAEAKNAEAAPVAAEAEPVETEGEGAEGADTEAEEAEAAPRRSRRKG